jgi:hypothetical protein
MNQIAVESLTPRSHAVPPQGAALVLAPDRRGSGAICSKIAGPASRESGEAVASRQRPWRRAHGVRARAVRSREGASLLGVHKSTKHIPLLAARLRTHWQHPGRVVADTCADAATFALIRPQLLDIGMIAALDCRYPRGPSGAGGKKSKDFSAIFTSPRGIPASTISGLN